MRNGRQGMEEKEIESINVIPLVDIMLVLLTIVLTTATFVVQGEIRVDLPESERGEERKVKGVVEVVITKEGRVYVGGKEVGVEGLGRHLRELEGIREVRLKADREARMGVFVKVMEEVEEAGYEEVGVVVERR